MTWSGLTGLNQQLLHAEDNAAITDHSRSIPAGMELASKGNLAKIFYRWGIKSDFKDSSL